MIACPSALSLRKEGKQPVDVVHRQCGRGLVEHQDLGVLRDRLDNLGQLPLARPEIADQRLGVDGDVQDVEELPGASLGGPVVDQAEAALGLAGQEDVLRHGKGRNQAHLLEDHGDAGPACGFGRDLGEGLAVDQDRAGVGNMDAVQDLEDRRLPGAVAA